MACLLDILRSQRIDRRVEDAEWAAMLELAEEEGVLPWVVELLQARRKDLPEHLANRLDHIQRDSTIAAFYWGAQLKELLRQFHKANIIIIPLKGPALAQRLYGSTALRMNRDLDLLVSPTDFMRAEALLSELGFTPGERDDYHRPWYRHNAAVELHYDVENPLAFDFGVEGAIRNAEPSNFQGQPCRQLAANDELAYLCLHGARHRYERLCLVLDLQLAFERLPGAADQRGARPEVFAMGSLVTLGLAMARRLQPDLQVSVTHSSASESKRLENLADGLWDRLLTHPGEPLDWNDLHRFYLEIERPGLPRLKRWIRHMQILSTRVIEPDYTFAASFGMHRTWQVRMMRPLRLLSVSVRSRLRGE